MRLTRMEPNALRHCAIAASFLADREVRQNESTFRTSFYAVQTALARENHLFVETASVSLKEYKV